MSLRSYPVIVASSIPIGRLSFVGLRTEGSVMAGILAEEATSTFFDVIKNYDICYPLT